MMSKEFDGDSSAIKNAIQCLTVQWIRKLNAA